MRKPRSRSSFFDGIRRGIRKDPLQGINIKCAKRTIGVTKSARDPRGIRQDPPILSSLPCLKMDKTHHRVTKSARDPRGIRQDPPMLSSLPCLKMDKIRHRGRQISAGSGSIRQDPPIPSSLPCLKMDKLHHRRLQISAGSARDPAGFAIWLASLRPDSVMTSTSCAAANL